MYTQSMNLNEDYCGTYSFPGSFDDVDRCLARNARGRGRLLVALWVGEVHKGMSGIGVSMKLVLLTVTR